jgi:hypothetical protein
MIDVFPGHVIAQIGGDKWKVPWSQKEGAFSFGDRTEVVEERVYKPAKSSVAGKANASTLKGLKKR